MLPAPRWAELSILNFPRQNGLKTKREHDMMTEDEKKRLESGLSGVSPPRGEEWHFDQKAINRGESFMPNESGPILFRRLHP
jgi:hypothetical protein